VPSFFITSISKSGPESEHGFSGGFSATENSNSSSASGVTDSVPAGMDGATPLAFAIVVEGEVEVGRVTIPLPDLVCRDEKAKAMTPTTAINVMSSAATAETISAVRRHPLERQPLDDLRSFIQS
jgi:hypothetical protein